MTGKPKPRRLWTAGSPSQRRGSFLAGAAVVIVFGLTAWLSARGQAADGPPYYSIAPPVIAIGLALLTGRLILSLSAAVVAGGLLSVVRQSTSVSEVVVDGLKRTAWMVGDSLQSTDNLLILLYVVLIMAMLGVILSAGGMQGLAAWLSRYARSPRSTRLVTIALGLIVFIDDYANTMIVGSTMRPVTDRYRISREKLAFLVDATAAPVAGIAIISTWIGYEVGLLTEAARSLGIDRDGYDIFFDALGFRFYCLGMIAFVFFGALWGEDFGPMAKAEKRSRLTGEPLDGDATPMTSRSLTATEPHRRARVRAMVALVPMGVLLLSFGVGLWIDGGGVGRVVDDPVSLLRVSVWREVFVAANSIPLLAWASAAGLLAAVVMALLVARVPFRAVAKSVLLGARGSLLPITILVLACSLKEACEDLQTGTYLASAVKDSIDPALFPAVVFVVAGLTAFATGTSWGTMAILIPTAVPTAFQLDGGVYGPTTILTVAAILDGAICGDHCSPISDTTIMSSIASSCDHLAHVRTQLPYSVTVAVIALGLGYLPAACGASKWVGILGGAGVSAGIFLNLRAFNRRRSAGSQEQQSIDHSANE